MTIVTAPDPTVGPRVLTGDPDQNVTVSGLAGVKASVVAGAISETVWTDNTNAYFVRTNKSGVISWVNMAGVVGVAPGVGARPIGATVVA